MLDWKQLQQRISEDAAAHQAPPYELATRTEHGFWRSLRELNADPELKRASQHEFAEGSSVAPVGATRRQFLQIAAAAAGLAAGQGCRPPDETILPYVEMPERIVPGVPLYYATALSVAGYGVGVLAESHMGRPTRLEGNQLHPSSEGAIGPIAQAAILELYDPDRSQVVHSHGTVRSLRAFRREHAQALNRASRNSGNGLCLLTQDITSPTLLWQIEQLRAQYPEARWYCYESVINDHLRRAQNTAFGHSVQPTYRFDEAATVLSLGANFLADPSWPVTAARHFMKRRKLVANELDSAEMNRLYVIESSPSLTGSKADHRWVLERWQIPEITRWIAAQLNVSGAGSADIGGLPVPREWLQALIDDLQSAAASDRRGPSLVVCGNDQPVDVQVLVHGINDALGNVGKTLVYRDPVVRPDVVHTESIEELAERMRSGDVETLVILEGDPVANAPIDLDFAKELSRVKHSVYWGLYSNETAKRCDWSLPATHSLESWSDVRAHDGTASIVQPQLAPLYDGVTQHQLLQWCMNSEPSSGSSSSSSSGYDLVRGYWKEQNLWKASPSDDSSEEAWERWWEEVLRRGVIVGTEYPVQEVIFRPDAVESVLSRKSPSHSPAVDGVRINADSSSTKELDSTSNGSNNQPTLSLEFVADPHIWDGRYANNAWLQELPKPFSKIVWGNALWISPRLADQRNLANGDVVRVTDRATSTAIELPVWIMPGQAPQTLTVHLGGGMNCGSVSAGRGTSVAALRRRDSMYLCSDVSVEPTGTNHRLATTQDHHQMEGRHPVLAGTLSEVHEHPESPHFMHVGEHHPDASMIGEWEYNSYKWGMAIDLTSCTGCSACVIACQAENNIPVVGPVQVEMGREMHWLRIDTYFHGEPDEPTFYHQPLACVHCEKAPCEVVCPVAATTHSDEGINEMTYNRCVGTRYCSNNCPYKVRRFNFLEYTNTDAPVLELLRNPNVTVRSRGVMEKCTYCVQRINHARVSAEIAGRRIGPDDIATACQAACPTQAITFGDLNRREFEVTAWRNSPLAYQLLAELNTQPRTSYLASVLNPNRRIQHHE